MKEFTANDLKKRGYYKDDKGNWTKRTSMESNGRRRNPSNMDSRLPGSGAKRSKRKNVDSPLPSQQGSPAKFIVRLVNYRKRTLDQGNFEGGCCSIINALRYAKLIPEDDIKTIREIKVQEKHKEKKGLLIQIKKVKEFPKLDNYA